jgi:pimeloyl-ACP methyl ester carboxylesterase
VTPLRIPGCGHFIMLDRPAVLANAIRRFARGVQAPVVAVR